MSLKKSFCPTFQKELIVIWYKSLFSDSLCKYQIFFLEQMNNLFVFTNDCDYKFLQLVCIKLNPTRILAPIDNVCCVKFRISNLKLLPSSYLSHFLYAFKVSTRKINIRDFVVFVFVAVSKASIWIRISYWLFRLKIIKITNYMHSCQEACVNKLLATANDEHFSIFNADRTLFSHQTKSVSSVAGSFCCCFCVFLFFFLHFVLFCAGKCEKSKWKRNALDNTTNHCALRLNSTSNNINAVHRFPLDIGFSSPCKPIP